MTKKGRPDRPRSPDIEFTADVKARELSFERAPRTEVRFTGWPRRESASGTDRKNLPDKVEEGVTYRDPEVRLRIASALDENDPELRQWFDEEEHKDGTSDEKRRTE